MKKHPDSVEDAIFQIENSFNRGGNYLQNGVPKYTAHAVRMEEETGIRGIIIVLLTARSPLLPNIAIENNFKSSPWQKDC